MKNFHFPATGTRVEKSAVLLAIDDVSWPLRKNLCLTLSKPDVRSEPVLTPNAENPNAPDALAAHFYGTVLHDEGTFRMWYYPCSFKQGDAVPKGVPLQWLDKNLNS